MILCVRTLPSLLRTPNPTTQPTHPPTEGEEPRDDLLELRDGPVLPSFPRRPGQKEGPEGEAEYAEDGEAQREEGEGAEGGEGGGGGGGGGEAPGCGCV